MESCHPEPCPDLVSGLFPDLGSGFRFGIKSPALQAGLFISYLPLLFHGGIGKAGSAYLALAGQMT